MGAKQSGKPSGTKQATSEKEKLVCAEMGTYAELKKKAAAPTYERDHVPATNSMLKAGEKFHAGLNDDQIECFKRYVKSDALTIAIPKEVHRDHSRTCSGRGGDARRDEDAENLKAAAKKDFEDIEPHLSAACKKEYQANQKKVLAQLPSKFFKECQQKAKDNC